MKEYRIESFTELHSVVDSLKGRQNTIYRGLKSIDFDLKSSVGRCKPFGTRTKHSSMEKKLLTLFKESSLQHLSVRPDNDWEWLAIGQHHGLPTRLMDWSYNPLAATFFAVDEEFTGDSVVYVFWGGNTLKEFNSDPLDITKVVRYRPPYVTARIAAQSGLFTAHPEPESSFEHKSLERIVISNSGRSDIKRTLNKYGVSRRHLFPGLDGIAQNLKWLETACH